MTKKTKYEQAVEWIALHDEPCSVNRGFIEGYITVALVADIFGRSEKEIADRIIKIRDEEAKKSWK